MPAPEDKRICGCHIASDGIVGAIWLATDAADVTHLYDACIFRREVLAVIAEGLNARGRWIPIVTNDKAFSEKLLDRGCNIIPEHATDNDSIAELISRDVWERMRTGRFKVEKRLKEWLDEFESFGRRADSTIPRDSHPLMASTRHAIESLRWSRRQAAKNTQRRNYPDISIL